MNAEADGIAWNEYLCTLGAEYDSAKLQVATLVRKLAFLGCECPAAITTPGDFGGLVLEWSLKEEYLELELHGATCTWFYCRRPVGRELSEGGEDEPELPGRVVEIIARIARGTTEEQR